MSAPIQPVPLTPETPAPPGAPVPAAASHHRVITQSVSSGRFLLSVAIVLGATVGAAYTANEQIVHWALRHHLRSAQLNLSAAMGGLFAGGLAALIAILVLTNLNRARTTPAEQPKP